MLQWPIIQLSVYVCVLKYANDYANLPETLEKNLQLFMAFSNSPFIQYIIHVTNQCTRRSPTVAIH